MTMLGAAQLGRMWVGGLSEGIQSVLAALAGDSNATAYAVSFDDWDGGTFIVFTHPSATTAERGEFGRTLTVVKGR